MEAARYLYAKFKLTEDQKILEEMIISEDKAAIENWSGSPSSEPETEKKEMPKEDPQVTFARVASEYEDTIKTFQRTVTFIMSTMPFMRRISDDTRIRDFIKLHGESLEGGRFETYRIDVAHLPTINRALDDSLAIASGVRDLPGMFLVGLVSAYDVFLSKLIRAMFLARPDSLSSSERNISFKDLVELGSIAAARERVVEKEIESIIRESHAKHIKWLEKELAIPLTKDLKIWPEFIEICERRNLLTHTGGVISAQYVQTCTEHGCDTDNKIVGEKLGVTPSYYRRAVSVFLEFGIKLSQVVWRKVVPQEIELAAEALNHFSYGLISQGRYSAAATMLRFGLIELPKQGSDAIRKSMVVNYANAEKLGGNRDQAMKILDGEDWSAHQSDKFAICVAAVRDEVDTVISMMRRVVDSDGLTIEQFQTWPVFEKLRSEPTFVDAFEKEFGQKIIPERGIARPDKPEVSAINTGEPDASDPLEELPERTIH